MLILLIANFGALFKKISHLNANKLHRGNLRENILTRTTFQLPFFMQVIKYYVLKLHISVKLEMGVIGIESIVLSVLVKIYIHDIKT